MARGGPVISKNYVSALNRLAGGATAAMVTMLMAGQAFAQAAPTNPTGEFRHGDCASLTALKLDHVTYTMAGTTAAGDFVTPAGLKLGKVPAFCRVAATLTPSPASNIRVEVWLPDRWNGKFLGNGTGGLGGNIDYYALIDGLQRGYAVSNSDLGTSAGTEVMVGNIEQVIDFGHRAVHEMTLLSKTLITHYYSSPPSRSYLRGCSSGGGQGLHEAQRYPDDYDGIIAGAPVNYRVPDHISYLWTYTAAQRNQNTALSDVKKKLWADKVMEACDALDGLKDGLITRPDKCKADPAVIQCKGADAANCLLPEQVDTLRKIYEGPRRSDNGKQIGFGYEYGTELSFPGEKYDPNFAPGSLWPFQWIWGMKWNWRSFNYASDVDAMNNALNFALESTNTNLRPFKARGGKLIMYQGMIDPVVVPTDPVAYLKSVEGAMPGESAQFIKLFNFPGVAHCAGGYGPNVFGNIFNRMTFPLQLPVDPTKDILGALEQWVEKGREPTEITAAKFEGNRPGGKLERTMPVCAFPKVSKYKGTGDPNAAASFSCVDAD